MPIKSYYDGGPQLGQIVPVASAKTAACPTKPSLATPKMQQLCQASPQPTPRRAVAGHDSDFASHPQAFAASLELTQRLRHVR